MDTNTGPVTTKGCEAMTETTAKKYKTTPERLQRKAQLQADAEWPKRNANQLQKRWKTSWKEKILRSKATSRKTAAETKRLEREKWRRQHRVASQPGTDFKWTETHKKIRNNKQRETKWSERRKTCNDAKTPTQEAQNNHESGRCTLVLFLQRWRPLSAPSASSSHNP